MDDIIHAPPRPMKSITATFFVISILTVLLSSSSVFIFTAAAAPPGSRGERRGRRSRRATAALFLGGPVALYSAAGLQPLMGALGFYHIHIYSVLRHAYALPIYPFWAHFMLRCMGQSMGQCSRQCEPMDAEMSAAAKHERIISTRWG